MRLDRWIAEHGPLEPKRAVGWALRLAKTLHRLHRRGVVHGNLCAQAVEIDGVEPFQPGRLRDADAAGVDPQYHSRRRTDGAAPSEADDVWATGVLLYFALTGAAPFPGATDADVRARIDWLPASPIHEHGCDADDVQALLSRLLSKDAADRITSAGELRQGLLACRGANEKLPPLEVSEQTIVQLAASRSQTSKDLISEWLLDDDPTHDVWDEPSSDDFPAPAPALAAGRSSGDDGTVAAVPAARPGRSAAAGDRSPRADAGVVAGGAAATAPSATARTSLLKPALLAMAALAVALGLYLSLRGAEPSATPATGSTARALPSARTAPTGAQRGSAATTAPAGAPAPTAGTTAPAAATVSGQPAPSATASEAPDDPPTSSPGEPPASPPAGDVDRCVMGAFPEDTFAIRQPAFDFLCPATDPIEGALAIRSRLVWAGKGRALTGGMKEWSQLGWYDMATVGLIQARCCPAAPKLVVPGMTPRLASCKLQEALVQFCAVAIAGSDDEVDRALGEYTDAVRCLSKVGAAKHFGYDGGLTGGEITFFKRFLERVRPARR